MPFIHIENSIKSRRIQNVIRTLEKALTKLAVVDSRAYTLVDEELERDYIASLSLNSGDAEPVLPLGTYYSLEEMKLLGIDPNEKLGVEDVFRFRNLGFQYESQSQFIEMVPRVKCLTELPEISVSNRLVPTLTTTCPELEVDEGDLENTEIEVDVPPFPDTSEPIITEVHINPLDEHDINDSLCVGTELVYDTKLNSILERERYVAGDAIEDDEIILADNIKIKQGLIILKNLEKYDYDYNSYEILNEITRALVIFLDSVEAYYAKFTLVQAGPFIDAEPTLADDDSGADRQILVYDTEAMDTELEDVVFPLADTIVNVANRAAVKLRYRELRDDIKFFNMFDAVEIIEKEIENLLFCVNGSKKYNILLNTEVRALEFVEDPETKDKRITQFQEEVFFPFHNKAILEEFSIGLSQMF